ncbi:hypothetical protein [Cupriavidus oxalaticus]|uniref:Uncharacterized protein n=1 Tax=Cupriavidus oxalaticus TaxID=96344 RepID=A0A4P7LLL0_9BURK|nr:hypothetical protein [Cupriavidus oxalaticus]QBY56458.1 hypothetical protein E0W60_36365 [Cupriavidus oxalaticus]
MTEPTVTIGLNFTVPAMQAPGLLQKLIELLPPGSITSTSALASAVPSAPISAAPSAPTSTPQPVHAWPPIKSTDEEYRALAEQNLMNLRMGLIEDAGWGNVKNLVDAIKSLRVETRRVIMQAADNGGHVSREEVFHLIERDDDKSLRGFTRPAVALTEKLKKAGELGEDFKELLKPVYKKSKSFQSAQGFVIPLQVVRMLNPQ